MKISDFKIGQEIYFFENRGGRGSPEPKAHVIKKIGRKWIAAGVDSDFGWRDQRFDPETMTADGGQYSSPGYYVTDLEQHKEELEAESLWWKMKRCLEFMPRPKHMTGEAIKKIIDEIERKS